MITLRIWFGVENRIELRTPYDVRPVREFSNTPLKLAAHRIDRSISIMNRARVAFENFDWQLVRVRAGTAVRELDTRKTKTPHTRACTRLTRDDEERLAPEDRASASPLCR